MRGPATGKEAYEGGGARSGMGRHHRPSVKILQKAGGAEGVLGEPGVDRLLPGISLFVTNI